MHGVIREELFEDDRFSVFWRVQPNDRSANYLELWFPEGTKIEDFSIGIRDPRGRPAYPLAALAPRPPGPDDVPEFVVSFPTEAPIGQISADYFRDKLWRVMVALAPTEPDGEKLPAAEAGLWFVDVARKKGAAVASGIECRIQRNSDVIGYTSGSRQSYFADWRDLPFDASGKPNQVDQPRAFIRRFGSLNGIATHDRVTLTAGLVTLSRDAACYSSAGYAPDRDAPRDAKVLCSAASDRADALQGIRGPGTRSGSYFALDGTSAAAPIVARQLVRAFQKNPAAGRRGAKDNYVSLLPGTPPRQERRTRLGMKMVPSS
jgi:hypothetical protein